MAKRKPKTRWDDDPSSAKNTFKRANERGRQTEETEFRSKVFPRSPKAPRYFIESSRPQKIHTRSIDIGGPGNKLIVKQTETGQRRVQRIGEQMGRATLYSRLTGGGSGPGLGMGQGGRGGGGLSGRTK